MKKILLFLTGILLINFSVDAQYKINKTKYNFKEYKYQVGDRHNPSVLGYTSFIIPGLGQMISGEGWRGSAFLGGAVGCGILTAVGVTYSEKYSGEEENGTVGSGLVIFGLVGMIAVDIWATVDAIRVAKVNNMAWRDENKIGYNFRISPYVGPMYSKNIPVGLSLKVRF